MWNGFWFLYNFTLQRNTLHVYTPLMLFFNVHNCILSRLRVSFVLLPTTPLHVPLLAGDLSESLH